MIKHTKKEKSNYGKSQVLKLHCAKNERIVLLISKKKKWNTIFFAFNHNWHWFDTLCACVRSITFILQNNGTLCLRISNNIAFLSILLFKLKVSYLIKFHWVGLHFKRTNNGKFIILLMWIERARVTIAQKSKTEKTSILLLARYSPLCEPCALGGDHLMYIYIQMACTMTTTKTDWYASWHDKHLIKSQTSTCTHPFISRWRLSNSCCDVKHLYPEERHIDR